ncbi:DNA helicase [Modestobacter sp. I12A-02628]|uniref:DNA helicase n=1 Tax=Goekera deserti TaxID=2497753 RepID=A0A7K3WIZ6_9ACTN|nr:AAA domain-containing protein [Goekera deserti]MPQ96579.1 DNA helicase [Goekera deserti]NDI47109.1 DNA helicase [Goekera deserti]NEL55493.1 DNA helicase [Goekera deserti]
MRDVGGHRARPAQDTRIEVRVDVVPVLSRALARRAVPLVPRLVLTATTAVSAARVRLAVRDVDGPLGTPVERTLDLPAGTPVVLHDLDLRLDDAALARDDAAVRPGVLDVRVTADGLDPVRSTTALSVLGPAQWQAAPVPLAHELLAGHVQPGSPAIAALVGAATDLLAARTGSGTLPVDLVGGAAGGRASPARVDQTAAALVEALRRRAVRLLPAPAGWADSPQTVRTPTQVLDERAGSALDLALVLAAALEHAGLRPLVWLTGAHAFVGYWRTARSPESAVTTRVEELAALVEDGSVHLVEPTLLAAGAGPATFGDLHRTPQAAWLSGDLTGVVAVVDVHRARLDGAVPLPLPTAAAPTRAAIPAEVAAPGLGRLRTDAVDAGDLDELAARLPLPADAGQLAAIADALAGRSLVLDGAPGTGRTQTVVDLVARAVADGQRVLVLAGPPSLPLLATRLDDVGLAPFTADLRAEPSTVRARLRAALRDCTEDDELPAPVTDDPALTTARQALADHARRVHGPNRAGLSLYAAHAGLLRADPGRPALPVPGSVVAHTTERTVEAMRRALTELPPLAAATGPRPGHPWGFVDRPRADLLAVHGAVLAVDRAVDGLLAALPAEDTEPSTGALVEALGAARTPDDVEAVAVLLDGPVVSADELDRTRTPAWETAAVALLHQVAGFVTSAQPALEIARPAVLDLPLAELAAEADTAAASRFGRGRRLAAVLDRLAPALHPGVAVAPAELPVLLAGLLDRQEAARALARRAGALPGLQVPEEWNPLTDRRLVERQLVRLRRLAVATTGPEEPARAALRRLVAARPQPDPVVAAAVTGLRDAVAGLVPACQTTVADLAAWAGDDGLLGRWTATRDERAVDAVGLPSLHAWMALLRRLELLHAAGLDDARTALLRGDVPAGDALAAFDHGLAATSVAETSVTATSVTATSVTATSVTATSVTERRPAGRTDADPPADAFIQAAAAARAALATALPAQARAVRRAAWLASGREAPQMAGGVLTERGDLTHLLTQDAGLLLATLPCVLADPATAARLLPPTPGLFDLVIVDDADLLPAATADLLTRARTAVLTATGPDSSGPTSPGTADLAAAGRAAGLPSRALTWQHRARDEALAALGGAGPRLAAAPAPLPSAVTLLRVPGTFTRTGTWPGANPVEARAVVAELRRRIDGARGTAGHATVPSVAVITLHRQQQLLIDGLLRGAGNARVAAAVQHPDGVVVVHVDDAAGLERDVVLLSLGCSADDEGGVPLDLGPVGRAGGERAVDRAVSRAREQLLVVASFDPAQLQAGHTALAGVRRLRRFLDLAGAAGPATGPPAPVAAADPHRDDVAGALRDRGLVVSTGVGGSPFRLDLTVARPGGPPVLAVLLDGPGWAARGTAGDRDELPVRALLRAGWPAVERVWLPSWLADRAAVVERLVSAAEAAVAPAPPEPVPAPMTLPPVPARVPAPARPAATAPGEPAVRVTARPTVAPTTMPGEVLFRPWTPERAGEPRQLRRLGDADVAEQVRAVLRAGVDAEGPVHRERLAQLAAGAFGVPRVPERLQEDLLALLDDGSVFHWPPGLDRGSWTGFRRHAGPGDRLLEHVSPDEVGNAMVALCGVGAGMTRDELFARTLAVFGHPRRHPVLVPFLELGLAAAVRAERVVRPAAGLLIRAA